MAQVSKRRCGYAMWKKCPEQIFARSLKGLWSSDGRMGRHDQYISDKQVKYREHEVNKYRFKGKRIIPIVGIPEHTMVLGELTTGMRSRTCGWVSITLTIRTLESRLPAE